jgi:hypothetical protein
LEASADLIRNKTTFEDRLICEVENRGVWREFGDVCSDDCNSKFDKLKICDRAIRFSCDCGAGRCWSDKKCLLISDYKKTYEDNLKEEELRLSEEKIYREAEAKANVKIITEKLVSGAGNRSMSIDIEGAVNNYSEFYHSTVSDVANNQMVKDATNAVKEQAKKSKKAIDELPPIPTAPPIVVDNSNAQPTSFFLQQEEAQKKNNGVTIPASEKLPMIPLPE